MEFRNAVSLFFHAPVLKNIYFTTRLEGWSAPFEAGCNQSSSCMSVQQPEWGHVKRYFKILVCITAYWLIDKFVLLLPLIEESGLVISLWSRFLICKFFSGIFSLMMSIEVRGRGSEHYGFIFF